MPSQTMLDCITQHKRRHAWHLLEFVDRFAKILFFEMIQIKGIELFENGLQVTLESSSSNQRLGQPRKNLCQLGDGGDSHLIPVVELLLALSHTLIS